MIETTNSLVTLGTLAPYLYKNVITVCILSYNSSFSPIDTAALLTTAVLLQPDTTI
jgi:hypothetical protein